MTTDNFDQKRAFQLTRIIYLSVIAGSLAFMVLVFYITAGKFIFKSDLTDPLLLSLLIMCCTSIPFGYIYSRKICNKINPADSLKKKYSIYQTGLNVKLGTCEGVALIAIGFLLFTNNFFNVIFYFIALIVMLIYYPTPDRIGREIGLTQPEIELFY